MSFPQVGEKWELAGGNVVEIVQYQPEHKPYGTNLEGYIFYVKESSGHHFMTRAPWCSDGNYNRLVRKLSA